MKKPYKLLLAALLAAVMCLPVFGCGETETPPPDEGGGSVAGDNMLRGNDFENDDNRVPNRYDQGKSYTLTIQGGAFDDGAVSKSAKSGSIIRLDDLQCTEAVPTGKVLSGWYNVADTAEVFEDALTMPDRDITVAPVFDVATYAPRDGGTGGKIELYPKNGYFTDEKPHTGGWMIIEDEGAVHNPSHSWGAVAGERGAVYAYAGAGGKQLPAGWHFIPLSPYEVRPAQTYTFTYTLENQGTTPLSLKLYQTNKSSEPKPAATSAEVGLAAGETKTVTITFTNFSNKNVMTTVELVTAVPSLRLGMFIYSAIA